MTEWQWLKTLQGHPQWNKPKGKWAQGVMKDYGYLDLDAVDEDGQTMAICFLDWIDTNDPNRKSLSSSWKRWLRRAAQSGRRRKYKPHYPTALPKGKAIEPFMYRRY